ncbi:MAG TPA: chorismate mutase [Candidatus Acidoferrales bacterium]|nr:chorismate mutase [Candidatus Acidoferrales bacterium]
MKEIEDWRRQIDAIDAKLLRLLARRARVAAEIAACKKVAGLALRSTDRERQIVARACGANADPLDRPAIERLFRRIILESRRAAARSRTPAPRRKR